LAEARFTNATNGRLSFSPGSQLFVYVFALCCWVVVFYTIQDDLFLSRQNRLPGFGSCQKGLPLAAVCRYEVRKSVHSTKATVGHAVRES